MDINAHPHGFQGEFPTSGAEELADKLLLP